MATKHYIPGEFKRVTVTITFDYRYKDVTKATLREYLKEAVEVWGGQYDPGDISEGDLHDADPLFYGCRNVKVGTITDAEPKNLQLLLQADPAKHVGAKQVRGVGRGRRPRAGSGVQAKG